MIDDPAIRRAMMAAAERQRLLANVYTRERNAGADPLTANEAVLDFSKRLDAAASQVADDQFNRDLAVLRAVMERCS